MCDCGNFVQGIGPNFYASPGESVLDSLFREYEKVVFKSIVTAFGLEMFIKDQYGGDVDTIHGVRSMPSDPRMSYKSSANAEAYAMRGEYSHKDVEGTGTNYQRIKHDARTLYDEDNRAHTVLDAYEDRPLGFLGRSKGRPTDKNANLDHVIAVKSIHDDRGRVLAGLTTMELADDEDNLRWTNEHLNKSMGQDEIPDYIAAHPELPGDVKERMMDAYNQARASNDRRVEQAYYYDFSNPYCRQFYRETALAASQRGMQMGLRQLLGFLITELWFDVRDELRTSDGTLGASLSAVGAGLDKWAVNIREDYRVAIAQFGEGVVGGIVASLTTTLANMFVTTPEGVVMIIRQAWASIVEATSILLFNTREKYFCDRMTCAAKVLASGASMIVGTTVQQEVRTRLATMGLASEIVSTVSTFAGALSTGFLTVSLLFYIDNDPFGKFFEVAYGKGSVELRMQGAAFRSYCAELQKVDVDRLEREANYVFELSSELTAAEDGTTMNLILTRAVSDMGLPSAWGDGTLDDAMKDPDWVLRF